VKLKENIWRGLTSKWGAHNPKLHIQGSKLGVHREIRINAYSASMGESFVEGTLLRETCLEVHSFPDDPDRQHIRVARYVICQTDTTENAFRTSLSGNT
jgi:hypothetical protein